MTTEIQSPPAASPDTTTPAAPVAAPKPQVQASDLPNDALVARLEQAKNSARLALLAELGVSDVDAAKAAVGLAKTAAEAAKSDAQKLAEAQAVLTRQTEALAVAVNQAQAGLTEEQKAAVTAIAGQDQALWLKTYGALAPTWAKAAPSIPVAPPQAPPVAPLPTSTAPTTPAPVAGTVLSPPDHATVYSSLSKTNPVAAAAYLHQHGSSCYPKT